MRSDVSYLDRLVEFISGYASKEQLDLSTAGLIIDDLQFCFNRVRDRREHEGEALYVQRCRNLLTIIPKVRPFAFDKDATDLLALENVLLDIACKPKSSPKTGHGRRPAP